MSKENSKLTNTNTSIKKCEYNLSLVENIQNITLLEIKITNKFI